MVDELAAGAGRKRDEKAERGLRKKCHQSFRENWQRTVLFHECFEGISEVRNKCCSRAMVAPEKRLLNFVDDDENKEGKIHRSLFYLFSVCFFLPFFTPPPPKLEGIKCAGAAAAVTADARDV